MRPKRRAVFWQQPARLLLAWILAAVFLFAAGGKILHPQDFSAAVANYRILPGWLVNPAALFLPWAEWAAGVALVFSGWRRAGAWLVVGFSSLFAAAVLSALVRGLDINCGCFGPANHAVGLSTLLLDLGLLAAGWLVAGWPWPGARNSGSSSATVPGSGPCRGPHP